MLNPVMFMTALGVIYNVVVHFGIFRGKESSERNIPHWLGGFLSTLGGAYAACALLQIGIFMVGKLKKITGMLIIISSLLIFAKTYVCYKHTGLDSVFSLTCKWDFVPYCKQTSVALFRTYMQLPICLCTSTIFCICLVLHL